MGKLGNTPEGLEKADKTREKNKEFKNKFNIKSALKHIRLYCLACQCGSSNQVKECNIIHCELWVYRFGKNPVEENMQVPIFDKHGNITKWIPYEQWHKENN
jgi:hypothetical protein